MLFDTQPTPFDLRFRLLGFPVRVLPWFWLVMALLGEGTLRAGPQFLALWVLCGFVSVLVHELGHAVFYRRFGAWCDILLLAFGGLAVADRAPAERWKRVVISFAGPGFGFALLAVVVAVSLGLSAAEVEVPVGVAAALGYLFLMNLYWNLFNLLPIWPLDGGKICLELCGATRARNPTATAFGISFGVAAGLALLGALAYVGRVPPGLPWVVLFFVPGPMMTLWMVMFAVQSYQLWQQAQNAGRWDGDDDRDPWQR